MGLPGTLLIELPDQPWVRVSILEQCLRVTGYLWQASLRPWAVARVGVEVSRVEPRSRRRQTGGVRDLSCEAEQAVLTKALLASAELMELMLRHQPGHLQAASDSLDVPDAIPLMKH